MLDTFPTTSTEPEGYSHVIYLQGQGAAVPTLKKGRTSYSIARTGTGVYKISFPDDPGVFLGGGYAFGDATAANVLGWSLCFGAFTAPSGATPATLVVTVGNSAFAAADLLATSNLALELQFKRAFPDL